MNAPAKWNFATLSTEINNEFIAQIVSDLFDMVDERIVDICDEVMNHANMECDDDDAMAMYHDIRDTIEAQFNQMIKDNEWKNA